MPAAGSSQLSAQSRAVSYGDPFSPFRDQCGPCRPQVAGGAAGLLFCAHRPLCEESVLVRREEQIEPAHVTSESIHPAEHECSAICRKTGASLTGWCAFRPQTECVGCEATCPTYPADYAKLEVGKLTVRSDQASIFQTGVICQQLVQLGKALGCSTQCVLHMHHAVQQTCTCKPMKICSTVKADLD